MNRRTQQTGGWALKKPLRCGVDQSDPPVKTGRDQAAGDGMNDVFMQYLQAFERSAGVFELHAHLTEFGRQQPCQIGNGKKREKVDENDGLQRLEPGMGGAIRRHNRVIVQFQHRAVENESQRGHEVRPHLRQQYAGNDDHQWIQKIQRAVPTSGLVDDQTYQNQVSEDLQCCLQAVLAPQRKQQHVEQRKAVPEKNSAEKQAQRKARGTEVDDRQFNGQQQRQDKNPNPDQPCEPIAFIERG